MHSTCQPAGLRCLDQEVDWLILGLIDKTDRLSERPELFWTPASNRRKYSVEHWISAMAFSPIRTSPKCPSIDCWSGGITRYSNKVAEAVH